MAEVEFDTLLHRSCNWKHSLGAGGRAGSSSPGMPPGIALDGLALIHREFHSIHKNNISPQTGKTCTIARQSRPGAGVSCPVFPPTRRKQTTAMWRLTAGEQGRTAWGSALTRSRRGLTAQISGRATPRRGMGVRKAEPALRRITAGGTFARRCFFCFPLYVHKMM